MATIKKGPSVKQLATRAAKLREKRKKLKEQYDQVAKDLKDVQGKIAAQKAAKKNGKK
jgi:hypothetical protein